MSDKIVRYTELFKSIQGEGLYTGKLSVFLRFYGCNLSCQGFSQPDALDPTSWINPLQNIDPKSIKRIEDMPVIEYGCDTGYSVSAKFKHLAKKATIVDIATEVNNMTVAGWKHNRTNADVHLVFTGGEPMLWQDEMISIVYALVDSGNYPQFITVETNGTKELSEENIKRIRYLRTELGIEWLWSVSPKLKSVSGEEGAVIISAWDSYIKASTVGYLKFVINGTRHSWVELESVVDKLQDSDDIAKFWPIYIMPCGGTLEQQNDLNYIRAIAEEGITRGYQISGRLHVNIFGNSVNT